MDWPQIFTAIKDIVVAIAAGFTAVVAVSGIQKWRRELEGRAGFEAAKGLAKSTYHLRDALKACRNPVILTSEYPKGCHGSNLTSQEKAHAIEHVYRNRWKPVTAALTEFDTQALEAEALWQAAINAKTNELRACVVDLWSAIDAVIQNEAAGGADFAADEDFAAQMRQTVSNMSENYPFSKRIETAVTSIEAELKKHLGRPTIRPSRPLLLRRQIKEVLTICSCSDFVIPA